MNNDVKQQLVSIIVPIYNVETYLQKCLDSLVNQTYSNIEIICVNDGSTDSSLQILEEYAKKDSRIKIINQENQGVSVARNNGIDNATGDYILFVDSDDYLELNACEKLASKISENIDIICFKYNEVKKYKNRIVKYPNIRNNFTNIDSILDFYSYYKNILNDIGNLMCCGNLYKKDFLLKNSICYPENIIVLEDAIFCLRAFVNNPNILFINEYLYNYIINVSNSLTKQSAIKKIKQFDNVYAFFKEIINSVSIDYIKEYLYNYLLNYLLALWNDAYFSDYKIYYKKLLSFYIDEYHNNCSGEYVYKDYRRANKHIFLAKYHLSWWYWKIIRPVGKYCVVLPYRRFREFLRSKNG